MCREYFFEIAGHLRREHFCSGLDAAGEIHEERSPQAFIEAAFIEKRSQIERK